MADMAIAHGDGIEAAEIAYRAAKRRLQWRRRLLPAAGVLCALAGAARSRGRGPTGGKPDSHAAGAPAGPARPSPAATRDRPAGA